MIKEALKMGRVKLKKTRWENISRFNRLYLFCSFIANDDANTTCAILPLKWKHCNASSGYENEKHVHRYDPFQEISGV